MEKMKWSLIESIFNEAIILPVQKQQGFIQKKCGADAELLQELTSLLAHQHSDTNIHNVIASTAENLLALQEDLSGKLIGNYRIIKPLATGGMANIFLAERADHQYQQQVAIKLIRARLTGSYAKKAFQAERQILANLQHANISRLLDGGTLENNIPYLVMEYVQGEPIDIYCNNNQLSLKQRLALFIDVCQVVQYAHQNLIIHCDLKPSNILVTEAGEIKLLDFGISKLLRQPDAIDNDDKSSANNAFSLAYSSPEQLKAEPVSVMTDVYALGVVLFELLTKCKPYHLSDEKLETCKNAILYAQPRLASAALIGTLSENFAKNKTTISANQLTGDIDAIINKALQKSPQLRHLSAAAFANDIKCFVNNQLVSSRINPWWLAPLKLFKRNKIISSISFSFFIAITSFSAMLWLQSIQLTAERDRSETTLSFFTNMFDELDPNNEKGQNVLVRDVLDRTSESLVSDNHPLKSQPYSEATIRSVMGNIYLELGILPSAEQHLMMAMSLYQQQELTQSADYLNLLTKISRLYSAQFNKEDSLAIVYQSLALSKKLNGVDHKVTLGMMSNLAAHLNMQGEHHKALALFEEIYQAQEQTLGVKHIDTVNTLSSIGIVYHWLGQYQNAYEFYHKSHQGLVNIKGKNHPSSFSKLSLIGSVLQAMGKFQQAQPVIQEHIQLATSVLGDNHPEVLRSMHNLADVYKGLGEHKQAESLFRATLQKRQRYLGVDHVETLQTQKKLANLLNELGGEKNSAEALMLARQTFNANTIKLGKTHPDTISSLQTLADAYFFQDKNSTAKPLYLSILTMRDKIDEYQHHPRSINVYLNLANIHLKDNQVVAAEKMFNQAIAISEQHPDLQQQKIRNTALMFINHFNSEQNAIKAQAFHAYL